MSKSSFFNSTVYFRNLRRGWPIWVSYLLLWIFIIPVVIVSNVNTFHEINQASILNHIIDCSTTIPILLSFIFSIFTAMLVFSYMYSSRGANMLHSLPITRLGLYTSAMASGLTFLLVPNLIVFLITIAITSSLGVNAAAQAGMWLYMSCGTSFFFFTLAAFCAQFTGSILALPAFYLIVNFLAVFIEAMFNGVCNLLIFGYSSYEIKSSFLSPIYEMFSKIYCQYGESSVMTIYGTEILKWYLLAGIALGGLGYLFYRRRSVECAGDVVSFKWVYHLFRWGAAFCFGVGGALALVTFLNLEYSRHIGLLLTVISVIMAAIGWYIAEMLLRKSFKVFKYNAKELVCCCAVLAAVLVVFSFDVFDLTNKLPSAEDIKSADFGVSLDYTSEENINEILQLNKTIISSKDELLDAYNNLYYEWSSEEYIQWVDFNYRLKNGSTVRRSYPVLVSNQGDINGIYQRMYEIANSYEQVLERNLGENKDLNNLYYVSITDWNDGSGISKEYKDTEALAIANAVKADLLAGNLGLVYTINEPEDLDLGIELYFLDTSVSTYDSIEKETIGYYFNITEACTNTISALAQLAVE